MEAEPSFKMLHFLTNKRKENVQERVISLMTHLYQELSLGEMKCTLVALTTHNATSRQNSN
jgi:hypothetical protein